MLLYRSRVNRNTKVNSSEKRVFDINTANMYNCTNLNIITEAYQACHGIKDKNQREACYLVFGLDAEKVEYYYPVVENMEKMYYKREPFVLKLSFFEVKLFSD